MSDKALKPKGGVAKSKGTGLQKPIKITQPLADVLGKEEVTRPELTKLMWKYFKDNNLTDPADKRYIISDAKLKALTGEDRFLAFGFQKFIAQHIIKD